MAGTGDDREILFFNGVDEWDRWLAKPGRARPEAWLRLTKRGSGGAGMTAAEAGDVAICHGWIDSQRRSLDATHFLQRYSPRRPGSPWSQVNVERVAALEAAGRMRPAGRAQVEAAKADGRWDAAYASQRTATTPDDLREALADSEPARTAYQALSRSDQYALFLPLLKARTPAARVRAVRRAVARLESAGGRSSS